MIKIARRFFNTTSSERAIIVEKLDKGLVTFSLNRPQVRNAISR